MKKKKAARDGEGAAAAGGTHLKTALVAWMIGATDLLFISVTNS